MNRKDIVKALVKWEEQDKENRAILCLAVEHIKSKGVYQVSHGMAGMPNNLVLLIKKALKSDKDLMLLIRKAVQELTLEKDYEQNIKDEKSNN